LRRHVLHERQRCTRGLGGQRHNRPGCLGSQGGKESRRLGCERCKRRQEGKCAYRLSESVVHDSRGNRLRAGIETEAVIFTVTVHAGCGRITALEQTADQLCRQRRKRGDQWKSAHRFAEAVIDNVRRHDRSGVALEHRRRFRIICEAAHEKDAFC
jgi:hypothetical protein